MGTRICRFVAALSLAIGLGGCLGGTDFSPDGKSLVTTGKDGLQLVDVRTGRSRKIISQKEASFPSWSPDGRFIVYSASPKDSSGTWLYDVRARRVRLLKAEVGPPFAWREDSLQVVAVSKEHGQELVWIDVPSGDEVQKAAIPEGGAAAGADLRMFWLPGSESIFFTSQALGYPGTDAYEIDAGELRRLTTTGDIAGLSIAPDHRALLWARCDLKGNLSLHRYDLTTRTSRHLPFRRPPGLFRARVGFRIAPGLACWIAPDSKHVAVETAYVEMRPRNRRQPLQYGELWVASLTGASWRLTRKAKPSEGGFLIWPTWSRDGKQLAVTFGDERGVSTYLHAADGSPIRRLLYLAGNGCVIVPER